MTKLRLFLIPLLLLVCGAMAAAATFDPKTMMDVSEVQRGAKAVGRTVFAGTEISEFNLQIIDIMHQANLGTDMILARVLDGPVVARQSGIIGGMSGSPVYINGRLIGAIAWGWGFAKEPIAGITPIRPMLEALDMMDDKAATAPDNGSNGRWTASRPFTVAGREYDGAQVVLAGTKVAANVLPLRAVSTPINCSGMGERAMAFLKGKLERYGIEPMAGGGQKADPVPVELVPGAAVGVRFMEGDLDMTGIGTVTYRSGDKLLAFGHPMMQLGKVNLPLSSAWINDFMPSYQRSNKMGSGMLDVGALRADIPWAIGGQIGAKAPLIPARIEVVDKSRNYTRTFNIKVMRHPGLTASVLGAGIASALEATYNPNHTATIRTDFEIKGEHGVTLKCANQHYMVGSPVDAGTAEIMGTLSFLEMNRWDPQQVSELVYRAEITDRDESLVIEKVFTEETVAKAGKPVHVHVLMRPAGGELIERVLTVKMPLNLPKGTVRIGVSGGDDVMYFRSRFGTMMPSFDNLRSALRYLEHLEQNKQLCVLVGLPSDGVNVGSSTLMNLPTSITNVLEKSSRTDLERGKEELLATEQMDGVVYGRQTLTLAAEDRMGEKGSATAPAAPAAPTTPATTTVQVQGDDDGLVGTRLWWLASALRTPQPGSQRPDVLVEKPAQEAKPAIAAKAGDDEKKKDAKADDKAKGEEEEEDAKDEDKDDETATVLRQPTVWTQRKGTDFDAGEATGMAVRDGGGLLLAPTDSVLCATTEFYIWNVVTTPQGVYYATANPGRVYRVRPQGKPELVLETEYFGVRGLVADGQGNVYAGTWPGGRIYKITPEGKAAELCALQADYVWSLALRSDGMLVAGTGPEGQVYEVAPGGKAKLLTELPQAHVLTMLAQGNDMFLGTAGKGLVYRLGADGSLAALVDTNGDDVTGLTAGSNGMLYAGTSNGKVYRLAKNATPEVVFDEKTLPVYGLLWARDRLLAATGGEGKLVAITPDKQHDIIEDTETTHLLCLAAGPGNTVCVGSANAGELRKLTLEGAAQGSFVSSILDAKRTAQWRKIDWLASVPTGTELTVKTRSGNSANPEDGSWSSWSAAYSQPGVDDIASPAARYLQYRVEMKRQDGAESPLLQRIAISYLPANQEPKAEFEATVGEKPLHETAKLTWTASDDDKDTLLATVEYRVAGTGKWEQIKQLAGDKKTCDWDTAKVKDGLYDLRLTVSDEPSNPANPLSAQQMVYAVRVDNAKPEVLLQNVAEKDGKLVVEGIASDGHCVAEVAYQVDEQWRGAVAVDGVFDGQYEQFRLAVPLTEGKLKSKLRVRDSAGNACEQELIWPKK
ncbi:MAG: SpoIVB peptidase S55 domain-containing protein [Armatimonadia bacterium]